MALKYDDAFYRKQEMLLKNFVLEETFTIINCCSFVNKHVKPGIIWRKPDDSELLKSQYYFEKFLGYSSALGYDNLEFSEEIAMRDALHRLFDRYFTKPEMMMRGNDDPYPWHIFVGTDGITYIDSRKIGPVPVGLYLGSMFGFASIFRCSEKGVQDANERMLNEYEMLVVEGIAKEIDLKDLEKAFYLGSMYGNIRVASGLMQRKGNHEATDSRVGIQGLIDTVNFQNYYLAHLDKDAAIVGEMLNKAGFFKKRYPYNPPRSGEMIVFIGEPGLQLGPELFEGIEGVEILKHFSSPMTEGLFTNKVAYFFHAEMYAKQMKMLNEFFSGLVIRAREEEEGTKQEYNGKELHELADIYREKYALEEWDFKDDDKIDACLEKLRSLIESGSISILIEQLEFKKSYIHHSKSFFSKKEREEAGRMMEELGIVKPRDEVTMSKDFLRMAYPRVRQKKDEMIKKRKFGIQE